MAKNFIQDGKSLQWTNDTGSDVSSGDPVVVGGQVGVAAVDIADGESGTVYMEGVFECAKMAGDTISQGNPLAWSVQDAAFVTTLGSPDEGSVTGSAVAWAAAGSSATKVLVKLNVAIGTVQ